MKLSAYHKAQGDEVGFNVIEPDLVYVSIVFKRNAYKVEGIKTFYPDAEIRFGGSGHCLTTKLPDEIEFIKPDYSLYPNCDFSMGYTTRGCIRACHFCVVPKKEGKLTRWQHPKDFHDDKFNTCYLLDNNWYADKEWFFETSKWFLDNNIKVWPTQGMDIRILTLDIAQRLKELMFVKKYTFAWDLMEWEPIIKEKIKVLYEAGFNMAHNGGEVIMYVYVHDDSQFESGLYRCRELKKYGIGPYIMYNIDMPKTERIQKLISWANQKPIFWSCDYDEYTKTLDDNQTKLVI
jgi:hypothetical protein